MVFTTELEYLGVKDITSKKNNKVYHQVAFIDGIDTLTVFIDDNLSNKIRAKGFKRFDKLLCDFEIQTGQYTNLKLNDINAITAK